MKKLLVFILTNLILVSCASAASNSQLIQSRLMSNNGVPPSNSAPLPKSSLPNFEHIVLIMLENRDYPNVIGSGQMPLLNTLATSNILLSNYFAVAHPSLPNYLALMSGGTQAVTSDSPNYFVNQPNLADEIEASGRTWKSYLEGLPSPCFMGDSGKYAQKHNPLLYFDSVRLNTARCDRSIVPLTSLDVDLAKKQLPNFSFIMPDLCNSGHDCSAGVADKWVNDMISKLQASPALGNNSLIIIAFDEAGDKSTLGCCGLSSPAGGQVAVVLISPSALTDFTDNTPYSHYSLLKTILVAWNLPALGHTADASTQPIVAPWTGQLGPVTSINQGAPTASHPLAAQRSSTGTQPPALPAMTGRITP